MEGPAGTVPDGPSHMVHCSYPRDHECGWRLGPTRGGQTRAGRSSVRSAAVGRLATSHLIWCRPLTPRALSTHRTWRTQCEHNGRDEQETGIGLSCHGRSRCRTPAPNHPPPADNRRKPPNRTSGGLPDFTSLHREQGKAAARLDGVTRSQAQKRSPPLVKLHRILDPLQTAPPKSEVPKFTEPTRSIA